MIGIKLDGEGEFLDTNENTSISLKLENPIFFDSDKISPGSYTLPFDVPRTNLPKLKNPQVIENNESYRPERATIFFDVVPFKSGKINLNSLQEQVSTYFTFGLNGISDSFKDTDLRTVLNHTILIASNPVVKKVHTNAQQINIVMNGIVYGQPGWYWRKQPDLGYIQQSFPAGPTEDYVPFMDQVTTNSPGDRIVGWHWEIKMVKFDYVFTPLGPRLSPIACTDPNVPLHVEVNQDGITIPFTIQPEIEGYYNDFFTWLGPFLSNTIPTDDWLKYLRFPTVATPKLNPYREGVVVNHNNGIGDIVINTPERTYIENIAIPANINSVQPFINLRGVLTKISEYFEFEYEGDFWEDARIDYTTLWNTYALDISEQYIQQEYFNFWRRSFNVNELVPDISIVEFFKLLQGSFNIAVYYNEQTGKVRLSWREAMAKALPYSDITSKTSNIRGITPVTIKTSAPVKELAAVFGSMDLTVINFFIDTVNTIITNETSPTANNGKIDVRTIQDESLFQFSLTKGAFWQSTPLFSGLDTGIYIVQVRELATGIVNEYPFAVNHADINFEFNPVVVGETAPGASDGIVNIIMASEIGFEFSINGGSTWQSPPGFTGLAPGKYYLGVREVATQNTVVVVVVVGRQYDTDLLPSIPLFNYAQGDDFTLQFFKYEGLNTIDGYSYPAMSSYIFPTWPIWNSMMNRCISIKVDMILNLIDIRNIDWELKRRFDRTNYLIKSLDVQISNSGVRVTQAELYTLR
jgi:hypothetical protein